MVSLSGHRVAFTGRRRSTSCSSGKLMWKGRIVLFPAAARAFGADLLAAPAAAELARNWRLDDDGISDMIFLRDANANLRACANADQSLSTSMMAWAKSCGASCGRL
jgi:hypothetical protein